MSKHGENDIVYEAIKVVEEYGEIKMTDLKKQVMERMELSGHDMENNESRNDSKISQIIRNLKSHNNKVFFENIVYDNKTYYWKPYYNLKKTSDEKKYNVVIKRKKTKNNRFRTIITDYEKIYREKNEIGEAGEIFVLENEKRIIEREQPKLIEDIRHVSKQDGDGAGYDILSFDKKGQPIYIEVKTTNNKKNSPFYMSTNEYAFFMLHIDSYVIARVYNFDKKKMTGKIKYIRGREINSRIKKEVASYKMQLK